MWLTEMSMVALSLSRQCRRGGGGRFFKKVIAARESFSQYCRGSGVITATFFEDITKRHEFAQNFGVYKCNALRHNESHGFVTTALVKYSHSNEIRNIFF
jgi:hypothetical protein